MELERDVLVSPTGEVSVIDGEVVTAMRMLAARGGGKKTIARELGVSINAHEAMRRRSSASSARSSRRSARDGCAPCRDGSSASGKASRAGRRAPLGGCPPPRALDMAQRVRDLRLGELRLLLRSRP